MKNCCKCRHSAENLEGYWLCRYNPGAIRYIPHPHLMGGPRKCECYEELEEYIFKYPKKSKGAR